MTVLELECQSPVPVDPHRPATPSRTLQRGGYEVTSARGARQPYLLTSIVVSAVLTVLVGVFPALWMQLARLSFLSL